MKKSFFLMSMVVLFACSNNSSNNTSSASDSSGHEAHTNTDNNTASSGQNSITDMHNAMSNMMDQMKSMKPTGDPDYDFAMMMKHHHQGAVQMSKAELNGGTDETMKQQAQKIIDDQQQEIAELDKFLQNSKPSGNSDFGQRSMSMMTDMGSIKMESSSLDAMFASMMIPHHQDAVKMSQEYLKVGKNENIKKIAQNIIKTQPHEVQEFQQWLNNHKG